VRGGDRDRHARLADLEPAEPVHHEDLRDGKAALRLGGDLVHQRQRHLLVGLVLEAHDGASAVLVAHDAQEQAERAVRGRRRLQ